MSDIPRGGRPPYSINDRQNRGSGKGQGAGKGRQGGQRDGYAGGPDRFNNRQRGEVNGNVRSRGDSPIFHYQVVLMDDEEYGDALEGRLNALGHEGWRLVAIDEGRQYVFMQGG